MKKVLLIDDDPVTNFIHKRLIMDAGVVAEVTVAVNGKQGLDILLGSMASGSTFPDLIMLDINMPIMSGFEFLTRLAEMDIDYLGLRIVILSSSDNSEDRSKASDLGIKDFLVKPVTSDVLAGLLT